MWRHTQLPKDRAEARAGPKLRQSETRSDSPGGNGYVEAVSQRHRGACAGGGDFLLNTPVIFDGGNLFDPAIPREAGLEYFNIGRP